MQVSSKTVFIDIEPISKTLSSQPMEYAAVAVESGTYRVLDSIDCKIRFDTRDADPKMLGAGKWSPTIWEQFAIDELDAAMKLSQFLKRHATVEKTSSKTNKSYRVAQLAAHNAEFDTSRLRSWFERLELFFPAARRSLCTEQLAKWFVEMRQDLAPPYDYRLSTLAVYFSLQTVPDHHSVNDALTAVELAQKIASFQDTSLSTAA